jgi:type I restriction enzyme M protein
MVDDDIVEAIIGLPDNLFQNVSLPSAVLVLNRDKDPSREDEVMFINASEEDFYTEQNNHNDLTETGIERILDAYSGWQTEDGISRAVPVDEIAENDYNLSISLYIDTIGDEEIVEVTSAYSQLKDARSARDAAEAQVDEDMGVLGYE